MSFLTKEQILGADDRSFKTIEAWGGEIRIKSLSLEDSFSFDEIRKNAEGSVDDKMIVAMVACSIVDENGNKMFNADDIEKLRQKSTKTMLKIFSECMDLNTVKSGEIEEKAKNS